MNNSNTLKYSLYKFSHYQKNPEIVYKYNFILLTIADIVPVNFRKKWMAAEILITQPFFLPTEQALDQVKKVTANFHILWEL